MCGWSCKLGALAGALLAFVLAVPASAQNQGDREAAERRTDQATHADSALGAKERKFLREAAVGGMAEVEGGQLAADRAASEDVRSFGERMVKDHGKANEELKQLATVKGVELPAELDRKHRHELDRLSKLSGAEFDQAYMKHMVQDHKKDVSAFRKAATESNDPAVKEFAARTLPTLEDHLRMAQQVAAQAKERKAER